MCDQMLTVCRLRRAVAVRQDREGPATGRAGQPASPYFVVQHKHADEALRVVLHLQAVSTTART